MQCKRSVVVEGSQLYHEQQWVSCSELTPKPGGCVGTRWLLLHSGFPGMVLIHAELINEMQCTIVMSVVRSTLLQGAGG